MHRKILSCYRKGKEGPGHTRRVYLHILLTLAETHGQTKAGYVSRLILKLEVTDQVIKIMIKSQLVIFW